VATKSFPYAFNLALQSMMARRFTTILTILSIALSVSLLVGVERVRQGARESFAHTISKTDLIVGARGGTIQLLLYTVFRIGSATGNISYDTFQKIRQLPEVAWTIPYALGDSYRGFRVVGTNQDFYTYYRYRSERKPTFAAGEAPKGVFDVALGQSVAKKLRLKIGDKIALSHGVGEVSFQSHGDKPFQVVGILESTATPIDRSLYVTLEGLEALHIDWQDGAPPMPGEEMPAEELTKKPPAIHQVTAFLLGAKSRLDVLRLQRDINTWEDGLRVVSIFVVIIGLLGMLVSIYNSLAERRREMAILRSVGAGPVLIFSLMVLESFLLTLSGIVLGVGFLYVLLFAVQPILDQHFGIYIPVMPPSAEEWTYLALILALSFVLGTIPAYRAYRNTLYDGLTIRI
jgi:putative ABC transport system permease protein